VTVARIEDAAPGDATAVARMYREIFPEDAHATSAEDAEAYVREELARPWTRMRIAWEDGATGTPEANAVGFAFTWRVVDELHVLNVAVVAGARRRRIGLALARDIVAHARESGIARIHLEVRRGNEPAIALYRGLGFAETGVRRRYYGDGEDALELTLALG
jgi:ribosomal-protein-alanine N-acetyltransferase